jgi:hypothetical protein
MALEGQNNKLVIFLVIFLPSALQPSRVDFLTSSPVEFYSDGDGKNFIN